MNVCRSLGVTFFFFFTCRGRSAVTQLAQLKDFSAGVHLAGLLAPCRLQQGPKPAQGHQEPSSLTPYTRSPHLSHPAASAFLESFAHPPRTPLVPPCPLPLLPLPSALNCSLVPGKVGVLIYIFRSYIIYFGEKMKQNLFYLLTDHKGASFKNVPETDFIRFHCYTVLSESFVLYRNSKWQSERLVHLIHIHVPCFDLSWIPPQCSVNFII